MEVERNNNTSFLGRKKGQRGGEHLLTEPLTFSMSSLTFKAHWDFKMKDKQMENAICGILLFCCHLNKPEYINAVLVPHLLLVSKYPVTQIWLGIVLTFFKLEIFSFLPAHTFTHLADLIRICFDIFKNFFQLTLLHIWQLKFDLEIWRFDLELF